MPHSFKKKKEEKKSLYMKPWAVNTFFSSVFVVFFLCAFFFLLLDRCVLKKLHSSFIQNNNAENIYFSPPVQWSFIICASSLKNKVNQVPALGLIQVVRVFSSVLLKHSRQEICLTAKLNKDIDLELGNTAQRGMVLPCFPWHGFAFGLGWWISHCLCLSLTHAHTHTLSSKSETLAARGVWRYAHINTHIQIHTAGNIDFLFGIT